MSRQGDHGVILCEPSEISLCGAGTRDLHVRCGYTQRRRWDRVGMQVDAKCAIVAPAGSEAGTDRFPPLAVLSSDVEYDNVLATCRIDSIPPCSVPCGRASTPQSRSNGDDANEYARSLGTLGVPGIRQCGNDVQRAQWEARVLVTSSSARPS
mgnify:FL=1